MSDPVGIKQFARLALETDYGVLPNPVAHPWHPIDFRSEGITGDNQPITRLALRRSRSVGRDFVVGPWDGRGPMAIEMGPENLCQFLYASYGDMATTTSIGGYAGVNRHCFDFGNTQLSYWLEISLRDAVNGMAGRLMKAYPGCTTDSITFEFALGDIVVATPEIQPSTQQLKQPGAVGALGYSALEPFLTTKGSLVLPTGTVFELQDRATVRVDFGTLHGRALFNRGWPAAAVGPPAVTLEFECRMHTDAAVELKRFMGDDTHDFSATATQNLSDSFDVGNAILIAQTNEEAAVGHYYQMKFILPRLNLVSVGPIITGEEWTVAPLVYQAEYDETAGYISKLCIDNKLAEADITEP